jgi:hypothetical protein
MKVFILLSAIIELVAGLALFFAADKLPMLGHCDAGDFALLKLYGAAALAMGVFGLSAWRNYSNEGLVSTFLNAFLVFHIGAAMAARTAFAAGVLPDLNTTYLHGFLALITGWFLLKNRG